MNKQFSRTELIFGQDKYLNIIKKRLIIFGVGGVGAAVAEALTRFGFEEITFVDYDRVDETNLNRQIFTFRSNIGMYKCLALADRLYDINPEIKVKYFIKKLMNDLSEFNLNDYDYVIDAIDMVTAKINLLEYCYINKIPVISSMGSGNRIDACKLQVMDLYETKNDPLAKVLRSELKKRNVSKVKVVSSIELPYSKSIRLDGEIKSTPLSVSFVPPVSGYIIVSEVINDFLKG